MKCFNCGAETEEFLCENCLKEDVLKKIIPQLLYAREDSCDNEFIREYASQYDEIKKVVECVPKILSKFPDSVSSFFYCRYYSITKDPLFEEKAIEYINSHDNYDIKKQNIIYDLIRFYGRDDYEKPKYWCDLALNKSQSTVELCGAIAEYYSMVGEYDLAEKALSKMKDNLDNPDMYWFSNKENMGASLQRLENNLNRYKNGKPYWPITEERRKKIAKIYDEKGIVYQRISLKPKKVKECDFKPIKETYELPADYTCFWCSETYNEPSIKCIYQIGAVKVRNNQIIKEYESLVKPWDGTVGKKRAANELGVSLDVIESAKDVDEVIKEFSNFVENDTLVSTGALGSQSRLLTRSYRYGGFSEINNPLFDILDYASEIDAKFDLDNNNREYLINYFGLKEGNSALEKASINFELIKKLNDYHHQ